MKGITLKRKLISGSQSGEYYNDCKKSYACVRATYIQSQDRLWDVSMSMIPAKFFVN